MSAGMYASTYQASFLIISANIHYAPVHYVSPHFKIVLTWGFIIMITGCLVIASNNDVTRAMVIVPTLWSISHKLAINYVVTKTDRKPFRKCPAMM